MLWRPFQFATDSDCVGAACRLAGVPPERARLLRIRDTLALEHVVASESYLPEIEGRDDLEVIAPLEPWSFAS